MHHYKCDLCGILTGNSQVKSWADCSNKRVELVETGDDVVLASEKVGSDIGDTLVLLRCKILTDHLILSCN